jgi:fucose 4-O-acetylase-like acetyltransferase
MLSMKGSLYLSFFKIAFLAGFWNVWCVFCSFCFFPVAFAYLQNDKSRLKTVFGVSSLLCWCVKLPLTLQTFDCKKTFNFI